MWNLCFPEDSSSEKDSEANNDAGEFRDAEIQDPLSDAETLRNSRKMTSASLSALKPPEPLSFEGNISENWKKWKKKFEIYIMATECSSKGDEIKVAILLHTIGEEAYEKYETFELTAEQRKKYADVVAAFEAYCVPKKNESINRHVFFHRSQGESESFDMFLTDLKKLSADCEFGELKDSLIKDRIIGGIRDNAVKGRLLREDDLKLERCVKLCQAAELAEKQLQTLKGEPDKVNAVRTTYNNKSKWQGNNKNFTSRPGQSNENSGRNIKKKEEPKQTGSRDDSKCSKCGYTHAYRSCPAYNKECGKCHKMNHFAQVCRTKAKSVNTVAVEEDDDSAGDRC